LLAQMLDKLVDNAASFSPPAAEIQLRLGPLEAGYYCLAIRNHGPLLPAAMQHQLFDSMVSVRDSSDKPAGAIPARIHLGLGLHIVRLIVEFHRGKVEATNLADGSGVEFRVSVPAHQSAVD
jgi:two-component system sensor histidine kinase ChvG